MISAVAARQAAQAARQKQEQQATSPVQALSLPPRSPKHKPPSQSPSSRKKRKRESQINYKNDTVPSNTNDVFRAQNDVIVIEDDTDTDEAALSSGSGSDIEMLSSPPAHLAKRAWSPSIPVRDSSEDENIGGNGEEVPELVIDVPAHLTRQLETNLGQILSTYVPVFGHNVHQLSSRDVRKMGLQNSTGAGTVVVLEPGEMLCILGTCKLTLLQGSITVNGSPIRPLKTPLSIFAPRSLPLPIIKCRASRELSSTPIVNLSLLPQTNSTLVLLQEFQSNVRELGRVCRTFDGVYEPSTLPHTESMSAPLQIPGLYLVNHQTRDLMGFAMPGTWSTALSSLPSLPASPKGISQPESYLIKGPKNAGKSTFARTLLNTLLTCYVKVAYLDCDPGQSEFTPPGLVSLTLVTTPVFGPTYSHFASPQDSTKKLVKAHFVGAVTPKSGWGPAGYLDCVRDLIEVWRVELRYGGDVGDDGRNAENEDERMVDVIPLVVNMMGWTKGLGVDLTQKIEEMVDPTMIFEFQTDIHKPTPPSSDKTHTLEPIPTSSVSTSYTPADHRALSILSYFHAIFPNHDSNEIVLPKWNTILPLCAIPPYEVNLNTAFDQVVLLGAGSEDVVNTEFARVLNGAIVAFIQSDYVPPFGKNINESLGDASLNLYSQAQAPPPPFESSCVGLGLIRAVADITSPSTSPTIVHILTPVPPPLLANARILVKGEMELPIWGMLDFREFGDRVAGVEKGKVPYLQWGRVSEDAIGDERRRIRRNLMRKGQA